MATRCLQRELDTAIRLANQAGEAILGYYQTGVAVEHKPGDEPVTAADHAADALIRAGLRAAFPGDGLLTEESDDDGSRLEKERIWIVDPVDGTKDFIAETGHFVVQIALAINGYPVLGVVYQPTTEILYHAIQGQGAYRVQESRTERLHVSTTAEPSRMCLVVSHSHYVPFIDAAQQALGIEAVNRMGSVGIKVGVLSAGDCDLYLATTIVKEWDLCAPHALLLEAGGEMTNLCGEGLTYNKPGLTKCRGLIASNAQAHDRIVEALAPLVPSLE